MESVNWEEVLSFDDSYEGPDGVYEDNDVVDSCTVLPCVGRGVSIVNISEIRLPADYYAIVHNVQPVVQSVHASPKHNQRGRGKGRAQLMNEDTIKCFQPHGTRIPRVNNSPGGNSIPGGNNISGGDYRHGGNGVFVDDSLSQHNEAQQGTSFDEDFPPLSGSISDKSSVTSDRPDAVLNSQPDSLKAIAEKFISCT